MTGVHSYFDVFQVFWPWSGHMSMYIRVLPSGAAFQGIASGEVSFTVISPPDSEMGEVEPRRSTVVVPIKVCIA